MFFETVFQRMVVMSGRIADTFNYIVKAAIIRCIRESQPGPLFRLILRADFSWSEKSKNCDDIL